MEPVLEKFSARIKLLRKERNIKQEEMASFLDCSLRQYQCLEYGEVNVSATTLNELANYFGASVDYLLRRE